MKKIKGLLFDFNGTLFFDSKLHIEAFRQYFTQHGKEAPTDEFVVYNIFGKSNSRIYTENFSPDASEEECAAFAKAKEDIYKDFCLSRPEIMKLADGASEMLDYLKENGIPYAMATGSDIHNVNFYIKHLEIGKWFGEDNTVCFDGTFKGKPEPDSYLLAAKKIGLSAEECIVFEDGTSGIISAQRAKAGAIIAVYDHTLPSPLINGVTADAVYPDFTNWREILKEYGII